MIDTITTACAATATIPTNHGSRYLQQLSKHWANKMQVSFNPVHATIHFPGGAIATLDANDSQLDARIVAADAETVERMKDVLEKHLDRFAFREAPLPFLWQRV